MVTPRQVFESQGSFLVKGLFGSSQCDDAARWLTSQNPDELRKNWTESEPGVPLAIYSVIHELDNPIGQIASDSRITKFASELMGEETYIWSSKVNFKAAWCGAVEYYHQDFIYWKDRGYPTDRMLSCMVFLQPHTQSNGALNVIPGSHAQGSVRHELFFNTNGLAKWMIPPEDLTKYRQQFGCEVIEGSPGDALFFHTSLLHGSSHNISGDGRMICLVQMNTVRNEPLEVQNSSREFNLYRAKLEVEEARRRLLYFEEKLDKQKKQMGVSFGAPIPKEELR